MLKRAVQTAIRHFLQNALGQAITQGANFLILSATPAVPAPLGRSAKTSNENGGGSASATVVFLVSTEDERAIGCTVLDVEGTDANGPADFVRAEREVVDAEFLHVEVDFTEGLGRVRVEIGVLFRRGFIRGAETISDGGNGFQSAELVAGEDYRDQIDVGRDVIGV